MKALVLVAISFLFISYSCSSPLEEAYREQYNNYNAEIVMNKALTGAFIEYLDGVAKQEAVLEEAKQEAERQHRAGNLTWQLDYSKTAYDVAAEELRLLKNAEQTIADLTHKSVTEVDRSRYVPATELKTLESRLRELSDKKQELKITVVEKLGHLPRWWKE